ncbi:MAG: 4Fe-4S dicluster domain-containing protein [Desulfatitalea sp.]|nr:4Fe-4S dicluster domain-containing protein [Desulfatitalea sp.]NNJ99927.1 4Fe-4S dicluster domain-containing protein [Desulfatitalea sp.]
MNPILMTLLIVAALCLFTYSMAKRILPLTRMQPEVRWDRPMQRLKQMTAYAIGQKRFFHRFEFTHGLAHVLIFWGFLVVGINTIHLIGRGYAIHWSLPLLGDTFLALAYAALKDLFVILVMIGTLIALARRLFLRPARMTIGWEPNLILLWIFAMMALDTLYAGTLFIRYPDLYEIKAAFLGVWCRSLLIEAGWGNNPETVNMLYAIGYWGHVVMVLTFLNYLPYGKHFHVITSLPNVFFKALKPKGALAKQDLESEDAIYGVSQLEEMPFKRAVDMYTCTECGRCEANCPAHISEKPLSPKRLIMDLRNHLKKRTPDMCHVAIDTLKARIAGAKPAEETPEGEIVVGELVKDDVLWSCTTCGNCITNCPTLIEHVDHIVDMRRYLVQVEGRTPGELTPVFKNFENMSNPWGLASNARADWFESLGVKTPAENPDFEYLLYVGCAGSFDNRNKKVATTLVKLLQTANVNFACLGNDESCCGETVRRLGNEYLAQAMMEANVSLWKDTGVKKIITACPHCFNTFKNEYEQFGGDFTYIHHTEMIQALLGSGKLNPKPGLNGNGPVVYHDACYLGRYNNIFEAPRKILSRMQTALTDVVTPEREKRTSFCCGAGGGRMWMEEHIGERINKLRCDQLLETGARTLLTACPYCLIMLEDAIKDKEREDEIKVMDIAELVKTAITAP